MKQKGELERLIVLPDADQTRVQQYLGNIYKFENILEGLKAGF